MKVNFNLRDSKTKTKTSIVLVVRHYQKTLKFSTGHTIAPSDWDAKRQRPKAGQLTYIREALNQLEVLAENLIAGAGYLNQSEFSQLLGEATGRREQAKTPYVLAFIRQFCEHPKRKELKTSGRILYNFITKDEVQSWDCIDWIRAKAKDVHFESIDWEFRNKLIAYCKDKNFAVAYAQLILKRLGQFINESRKAGHHKNNISKESHFATITGAGIEKAKNIPVALTLDEVNKLASLELSGTDEKVRDLFLIGLFSGQRWSDYGFFNPTQVKGDLLRIYQQEKTENYCDVETDLFAGLVPYSLGDLLKKYDNASPIISTRSKNGNKNADVILNKRLKYLCRRAGIMEKVRWADDKGFIIKEYVFEKWEIVGTHTARRSCASIWYTLGMPLEEIASITGHTTTKQVMEYIGVTQDEKRKKRRQTIEAIKANLSKAI